MGINKDNPVITIKDLKSNLAAFIEKEFPSTLSALEVGTVVDSVFKRVGTDSLDKFLLNWQLRHVFMRLITRVAQKNIGVIGFFNVLMRFFESIPLIIGEDLSLAVNKCAKDGSYNVWYFSVCYPCMKEGVRPRKSAA